MSSNSPCEVNDKESNFVDHSSEDKTMQQGLINYTKDPKFRKCKLYSKISEHKNNVTDDKSEDMRCKFCMKTYLRRDLLRRHELSHKKSKPYSCNICFIKFCGKKTLEAHRRIHTGEKPFKCDLCEKSFNRSDTLKNHRRNHTNETPYECINCNKKFKFNSSLHSHKCIPESEIKARPFKCTKCNKTYINKCSLKIHIRMHNKDNSSEAYKCFICEKTFGYNFTLKKHLLLHSRENAYKCKFLGCLEEFTEKYQLIIHQKRDHTTIEPKVEKLKRVPIPARCKYCGKDFSRWISNLRRHERTHTNDKNISYKCNLCFRRFKVFRVFRNHAKFHQENDKKFNAPNFDKILKNQPIVRVKKLTKEIIELMQDINSTSKEIKTELDGTLTPIDSAIKQEIEDDLNTILNEIEVQNINSIKIEIDEALNEILTEIPQSNQKSHDKTDSGNSNCKGKLRCNADENVPLRMNNQRSIDDSAFSVVFNWPKSKKN